MADVAASTGGRRRETSKAGTAGRDPWARQRAGYREADESARARTSEMRAIATIACVGAFDAPG